MDKRDTPKRNGDGSIHVMLVIEIFKIHKDKDKEGTKLEGGKYSVSLFYYLLTCIILFNDQ